MVLFDEAKAPGQWYCQGWFGCLLFALVNSGMIDGHLFRWMKPNDDVKKKPLEERNLFELKVMAEWALITGYYPFDHKETFHTMYSSFMKLLNAKGEMETKHYNKKVTRFAKKIRELEGFFSEHDGKSVGEGTWNAGKHIALTAEDFSSADDLPFKSLICEEKIHWSVYLGMEGEDAIVIDSRISDGYRRIPLSVLRECKIVRKKNIRLDSEWIWNLLSDFEENPAQMLHNLRRTEFSRKITELICRLDAINFTERDYNRFVRMSRGFLERLDREHYRYEP